MNTRLVFVGYRLFFGLLTLVAIGYQLIYVGQLGVLNPIRFFSYFTNLSNIFAGVVLIVGAVFLIQRRDATLAQDIIRGASVAAIVLVFIVYGILLRNEDLGNLQPWVNAVIHYIFPLAALADWLLLPPKNALRARQLGYWLIYPLVYLVYTLIRGPFDTDTTFPKGWYPYPFLNPNSATTGGYGGVVLYCVAISAAFLVVSWLLIFTANRWKGVRAALAA
jgi:hypothetical protein